jgi:UDP-N-acetylglucosamine:LPS N-acetylglucosamine transferase
MSLALALKETLSENHEIDIVDPHPSIIRQYYTWVGRHFLGLWELGYKSSNNEKAALRLHKTLTSLIRQRLVTLIGQIKPQLIISPHPFLSYEVARAIEQSRKRTPLVFQLSELEAVHTSWLTEKNADAYLVPTREIFAQALGHGIDEARLHLTGIPLRKQFLQDYSTSKAETLTALDFDPTVFSVFLQGGAEGAAGIDRTVKSILGYSDWRWWIIQSAPDEGLSGSFSLHSTVQGAASSGRPSSSFLAFIFQAFHLHCARLPSLHSRSLFAVWHFQ